MGVNMYPAEEVMGSLEGTQPIKWGGGEDNNSLKGKKRDIGYWREEGREDKSSFCNSKFHKKPGLKKKLKIINGSKIQ